MLQKLFKSAAIYGLADVIARFIAFAIFPIYAHFFTVEEFGVFALVSTAAALVALIVNLGMSTAMQRFYLDRDTTAADRPRIVTTGLVVLAAWAAVIVIVTISAAVPFRDLLATRYHIELILVLLALATNLPSQLLQYFQDVLRVRFLPWQFTVVTTMKNVAGVALGLVLVIGFNYRLEGLFLGQLIAVSLAVPLGLWLVRAELTPAFDAGLARKLVAYGYPFLFGGFAYWVIGSLDVWMLGELSDQTNVGWYGIASKVAVIVTFANGAFGQAWAPFALKTYAEDPDYARVLSRSFSHWFFVLGLLGSALSLFAFELLWILTPASYWPATTTISALAAAMVMLGTTQITVLGLSLSRRTSAIARCAWITAGAHLLANILLIPRLGALGAGIANITSYTLLTGLYLVYSQRLHPLALNWGQFVPILLMTALAATAGILLGFMPWSPVLLAGKAGFICGMLMLGHRLGILNPGAIAALLGLRKSSLGKHNESQL